MALIGITLVALLVLPVGAAAKGKKKKAKPPASPPPVVSATATASTSADGQIVSPTAICPPGTVALGGGFSSEIGRDEEGVPTDLHIVSESRRDSPSSWHVEAAREDAGDHGNTISITVTVYCQSPDLGIVAKAKKPKKRKKPKRASTAKKRKKHKQPQRRQLLISEVSATTPGTEEDREGSATASCPAGLNVISGGYSVSPPPDLAEEGLSFPLVWANHAGPAQAWTASETRSGHEPLTLTSYAYCANTSPPLVLTGSGSVSALQTGSATTPACPAGHPLISGGFDNTPASAGGSAEAAIESTGSDGGWTTSAYSVLGSQSASLQAIAYCR